MTAPGYRFFDLLPPSRGMLDEVLAGLSRRQKQIDPKYFYDARGCALFEAICKLPEYYPTRTELAIMRAYAPAMAGRLGARCRIVEIGCGNSEKTRLLLDQFDAAEFIPIDIAREQLEASCSALRERYPAMTIAAVHADFAQPLAWEWPAAPGRQEGRRVLYFPGSTIGNFTPEQARAFLARWAATLGPGGGALIGVDLKKDAAVLDAAYNDAQGVTARFNLNVLAHLNRELGANFDLNEFRHRAYYDAARGRIEMHLESGREQQVSIAGRHFLFQAGETIHTENSYKYSVTEFQDLGRDAGYAPVQHWSDENHLFSVHYFELP